MGLQELSLDMESGSREELFVMPSVKDFQELSEKEHKYSLNQDGTLTLKNKLVMKEGTHNDVYYSWDELKEKFMTGEGAGLFYDHNDSVSNYAGMVKNLRLDEAAKEIRGDIYVTDKQAALNLSLGAKWGISPTIDAEKILREGKKYAMDPNFLSYSLVLQPAVRETMLNSANDKRVAKGENKMEGKERELLELAEANKVKDEEISSLRNQVEKLNEAVEESKKKAFDKEAEELCELEMSIGFTSEAEKNSRLEELKSMSAESRSHLMSAHNKYVKTLKLGEGEEEEDDGEGAAEELKENYLVFRKKYMEKNPKATEADVKAAFAKLASDNATKQYPYPYPEAKKEKMNEDLGESNADAQNRMKAELSSIEARQHKISSDILAYMKEQEKK